MKVLITQFGLWRFVDRRWRYLAKINKEIRELRKFEAQGLYWEGITTDFVGALNKETKLDIKVPPAPHIHWWDHYIVPISLVQKMLDRENYIGNLGEFLGLCAGAITICDRLIKAEIRQ